MDNTTNNLRDALKVILSKYSDLSYVKPDDIPNIDLYMDQVLTFIDSSLEKTKRSDNEKILTKTMINNYTKQQVLPPPHKKKYSPNHVLILIMIYYMKSFLSIDDIKSIMDPITSEFFDEDGDLTFDEIYRIIVDIEKKQAKSLTKDVFHKYNIAMETFKSSDESEDSERSSEEVDNLRRFAFICMLSFDVYVKRMLIEELIDTTKSDKPTDDKK